MHQNSPSSTHLCSLSNPTLPKTSAKRGTERSREARRRFGQSDKLLSLVREGAIDSWALLSCNYLYAQRLPARDFSPFDQSWTGVSEIIWFGRLRVPMTCLSLIGRTVSLPGHVVQSFLSIILRDFPSGRSFEATQLRRAFFIIFLLFLSLGIAWLSSDSIIDHLAAR